MNLHPALKEAAAIMLTHGKNAPEEVRQKARAAICDALGLDDTTVSRLSHFNADATTMIQVRAQCHALADTTEFAPFRTLAEAIVDDLGERAQQARAADEKLGSVLPNGGGVFLRHPQLLDPTELARLKETKPDSAGDMIGKGVIKAMLVDKHVVPDGLTYSLFTLFSLDTMSDVIGKVLMAATLFAGKSGALRTAQALHALNAATLVAMDDGDRVEAANGKPQAFYCGNPERRICIQAMQRLLDYLWEHGTVEGFDYRGEATHMRAQMVEQAPNGVERVDALLAELTPEQDAAA